jgi:hypothetical protein
MLSQKLEGWPGKNFVRQGLVVCNYPAVTDEFISSPFKGEVRRGMG